MEYITLRGGIKMPRVGFGLWRVAPEQTAEVVLSAMKNGYRDFDTAAIYRNEEGLGKAVAKTDIPRDELFLATKVWNEELRQDNVIKGYEASLKRIGVKYMDLCLIHWPVPGKYVKAWKELVGLRADGRARAIGVSNFTVRMLEILREETGELPQLVQVECHPRLSQKPLKEFCRQNGIAMQAYSPLMQGAIDIPEIVEIAGRLGRTPAQVILRWDLQNDVCVIPRSTNLKRQCSNINVFDFDLSPEDMARIDALNIDSRLCADPDDFNF